MMGGTPRDDASLFYCHPEASEGSGCCALAPNVFLYFREKIMGFFRYIVTVQSQNSQILRRPQDDNQFWGSFANIPP